MSRKNVILSIITIIIFGLSSLSIIQSQQIARSKNKNYDHKEVLIQSKKYLTNLLFNEVKSIGNNLYPIELLNIDNKKIDINTLSTKDYNIYIRFFSQNCLSCYSTIIDLFNEASKKNTDFNFIYLTDFEDPRKLYLFIKDYEIFTPCFSTLAPLNFKEESKLSPYIIVTDKNGRITTSFALSKNDQTLNKILMATLLINLI